jgi:hypothetical protein
MSNSSYLSCLGSGIKKPSELYAEVTLPVGWAWLFTPEDFYVGHPRDNPAAAPLLADLERKTTSYLFCDAEKALPRFTERMRKVGYLITGKGMVAQVHAWLSKHMSKGYWYADTTELEWWEKTPGEGVEAIRKALAAAAAASRFTEPSAENLLLTFGWGTGLSVEELNKKKERSAARSQVKQQAAVAERAVAQAEIAAARQAPVDVSTLEGRPYNIRESFKVGDQIAHPVFKTGVVTEVTPTKITVAFPTGPQLLVHQRT